MTTEVRRQPRLRPIALPAEHGGWSFVLEPILLGWLVAFSAAGLWYGVGVFFAFMARHPLKLALLDWRRGQRLARTPYAERFALGYGGIALIAFALALITGGVTPFVPLLIAAPLFLLQAYWDASGQSRELLSELIAPAALAVIAACIVLAVGWTPLQAAALWALIAARALPSVLYVRARLRLERGKAFARAPVFAAHGIALLALIVPLSAGLIPVTAWIALVGLTARALYGLSAWRKPSPPKVIGVQEVLFGAAFVVLTALGYAAL
jgi:hypothetical protein